MEFSAQYRDTLTEQISRATSKFVEHIKACNIPKEDEDIDDMEWRSTLIGTDLADTLSASLNEFSDPTLKCMVLKEIIQTWVDEQFVAPGDNKITIKMLIETLAVPSGE